MRLARIWWKRSNSNTGGSDVVFMAGAGHRIHLQSGAERTYCVADTHRRKARRLRRPQSDSQTEVMLQGETFLALQIAEGSPSAGEGSLF